uniref:Uncharacterized protein n=1 Tax=Octopus bimaculoides TaxID=37653 RepID=A0A0L8G4B9_OCTBM
MGQGYMLRSEIGDQEYNRNVEARDRGPGHIKNIGASDRELGHKKSRNQRRGSGHLRIIEAKDRGPGHIKI